MDMLTSQSRRGLNYDLQALYNLSSKHSIQRCIVFFQNSEGFDSQVLGELVDVLVSVRNLLSLLLFLLNLPDHG